MDHQQVDSFFKFHRDLKVSRGPHLAGLHDSASFEAAQQDPEEFLDQISKEQDFFVTYVDVEEKSKDDKNHCFVQLSTNPVTVCFGIGQSPNQAKLNSAANALQYLRIMTK
jgi:dsRNA-specific ribonuclease